VAPEISLPLIDAALSRSPYAADLWVARMERQLAAGRLDDAAASFDVIRQLVPRSSLVLGICGMRKDCRVQFRARLK
jgi:hypothetical protein